MVQVTKDPVGQKGARLTSQVSLPGRYLVYVPNGSMNGISRKLPDSERARLKKILKETEMVVEGVETAHSAYALAKKLKVQMPITEAVHGILFGGKAPKTLVGAMMKSASPRELD